MLEKKPYPLDLIYVPVKRAKTLDQNKVLTLAEDILKNGQKTPIQIRADNKRFVLIEGLHRLEAIRALGGDTVEAFLVRARLH
ncbi:ParB N-terminal domain-containing protein [Ruegeria sp. 6PALISEP08]|uniref:ParB N-terminal domain-containing protein n=1 Tax=Ruegeria sp. 6PALISEP08 TaxID=1225660 RepID=UPI0009F84918|nr:ParB N-terminal domain-containing protein [Ruegeria sp. 6PALISEP08]